MLSDEIDSVRLAAIAALEALHLNPTTALKCEPVQEAASPPMPGCAARPHAPAVRTVARGRQRERESESDSKSVSVSLGASLRERVRGRER